MDSVKNAFTESAKTAKFKSRQGTWDVLLAPDGTLDVVVGYNLVFNVNTPGDSEKLIASLAGILKGFLGGGNFPGNLTPS